MATDAPPVTMHIALAPGDVRHARDVLPHQLRVWSVQVQEIICTLDLLKPFGPPHEDGRELIELVDTCIAPYPHARRVVVDSSDDVREELGRAWFEDGWMPLKDWRGTAPFYSYFYGWEQRTHDHVFHVDSDMVFGGNSATWMAEALAFLASSADVLACQPLTAPPTEDGDLRGKQSMREPYSSLAYRWDDFSTQCFLIDMSALRERVGLLSRVPHASARGRVSVGRWLKALPAWNLSDLRRPLTLRYPPTEWVEYHIAEAMRRAGLYRVSMLGAAPGVWMVHPGHRTERVYEALPALVHAVERDELPDVQRGRRNLDEAAIDALLRGGAAAAP